MTKKIRTICILLINQSLLIIIIIKKTTTITTKLFDSLRIYTFVKKTQKKTRRVSVPTGERESKKKKNCGEEGMGNERNEISFRSHPIPTAYRSGIKQRIGGRWNKNSGRNKKKKIFKA